MTELELIQAYGLTSREFDQRRRVDVATIPEHSGELERAPGASCRDHAHGPIAGSDPDSQDAGP